MNKFKDLSVWQKSIDLAETVYMLTAGFPYEENMAFNLK